MARRKIVVDGRVWRYSVGTGWCVAKADDNGEGRHIDLSELTNTPWADIERSLWKGGSWCVTPKHVANWLKGNV